MHTVKVREVLRLGGPVTAFPSMLAPALSVRHLRSRVCGVHLEPMENGFYLAPAHLMLTAWARAARSSLTRSRGVSLCPLEAQFFIQKEEPRPWALQRVPRVTQDSP